MPLYRIHNGSVEKSWGKTEIKGGVGIGDAEWCETPCKWSCRRSRKAAQLGDSSVHTVSSLGEGRLWLTIGHYHDRPSPTLGTWYCPITKLRSQASLYGVNHNAPFPTALKIYLWYYLVVYFDAIGNVSAHWKHAEGMSLRLGEIVAIDWWVKLLFALSKLWIGIWKLENL